MRNNEAGRSMIEMLGVLAIIGILSAGGIAGYTMAMKTYRANKAIEQFRLTSTEIITAFGESVDFTNLNGNADRLKLDLTSPYGGNIEAQGSVGSFNLAMNNVPGQACVKISQIDWGDDYVIGTANKASQFTSDPFTCEETNVLVFTYLPGTGGGAGGGPKTVEQCGNEYQACVQKCGSASDPGFAACTAPCLTAQMECFSGVEQY